jgi:hypothetical protein
MQPLISALSYETVAVALVAAVFPFLATVAKEILTAFKERGIRAKDQNKEAQELDIIRDKNYQEGVMQMLEFLEKRNELLTEEVDRLRKEREEAIVKMYEAREDKMRLEIRSELRMQMVREGGHVLETYEHVTEMDAFKLKDTDAFIISQDDKKVFTMSSRGLAFFGFHHLNEVKGRDIDDFLPGVHVIAFKKGVSRAQIGRDNDNTSKAGILSNSFTAIACHRTGTRTPVVCYMKTWTDGSKLYYAVVIELEPPVAVLPDQPMHALAPA